jgi:hypothetical protein
MAAAVFLGLSVLLGIALAVHDKSPGWLIPALVFGLVAYLSGRSAIGTWRACLTITTAEVVIVGLRRTDYVPLGVADRFEPRIVRSGLIGNGDPMIVLLRRGAEPVPVHVFRRGFWVWNFKKVLSSLEGEANELNLALAQARAVAA